MSEVRSWFEARGWRLILWSEYAEARKPGRTSHSIKLDEYSTLEAELWRLSHYICQTYPEERDVCK
jgi:hypothetical protein